MKCVFVNPEVFEAFTFDEFVEYGRQKDPGEFHDSMPWSFDFYGAAVTHETDEKYIVTERQGQVIFTKDQTLVVNSGNLIVMWDNEDFKKFFKAV